jgi:hypothetical protein
MGMDPLRPGADVGGIRRGRLQRTVEDLGLGGGVLHGLHPFGHDPGRLLVGSRRPGDEQRHSREAETKPCGRDGHAGELWVGVTALPWIT